MAYRVTGIRDSEKEGWYNHSPEDRTCFTSRTEVETPLGVIIVEVASDQDYPGVWLSFRENGDSYERTVALLEAEAPDCVALKVWERAQEDGEDWSVRYPVAEMEVS